MARLRAERSEDALCLGREIDVDLSQDPDLATQVLHLLVLLLERPDDLDVDAGRRRGGRGGLVYFGGDASERGRRSGRAVGGGFDDGEGSLRLEDRLGCILELAFRGARGGRGGLGSRGERAEGGDGSSTHGDDGRSELLDVLREGREALVDVVLDLLDGWKT